MPGGPGRGRGEAPAGDSPTGTVAGPAQRFEDVYLQEFASVFGLAYALSGSRWAAEDIAQDAFVVAHRQWGRIGGYDDPGAWVRRVAANLAVSRVRRRLAEARAPRQPEVIAPPRPLGRVAATIALPQAAFPRVVGVVDGRVWVDGGDATAYRVDPQNNRVIGPLRLPTGSRLAAVARGSLWLANEAAGTVSQADPRTGRTLRTVRVGSLSAGPDPNQEQLRLAVDGNTVWVARLHTDVVRLDWAAGKVAGRYAIGLPGSSSYDVIAAGSGVAVTHGEANDADQLDPRTGAATAIHLGGDPAGAAFGAGSFWVSAQNSTLARIDPASRRVAATTRLDANHLPGAVVVGDGAVWVFAGGGLLQRIDVASNQVVHTLAVGPDGVDRGRLAVGAGSVWLSDAEARTLIRIDTQG